MKIQALGPVKLICAMFFLVSATERSAADFCNSSGPPTCNCEKADDGLYFCAKRLICKCVVVSTVDEEKFKSALKRLNYGQSKQELDRFQRDINRGRITSKRLNELGFRP
jgi:hypothetical protein